MDAALVERRGFFSPHGDKRSAQRSSGATGVLEQASGRRNKLQDSASIYRADRVEEDGIRRRMAAPPDGIDVTAQGESLPLVSCGGSSV